MVDFSQPRTIYDQTLKGDLIGDTSTYGLYNGQPINIGQKKDMGHLRIRNTNK